MIQIEKIVYHLPKIIISNEELKKENPHWNIDKVAKKSGVNQRYVTKKSETAFDLAKAACDKLIQEGFDKKSIDGIIFCTQSPDYIMPSNAFLIHSYLELKHNVLAFDYNLACSGYIYGLAIAHGLIATGVANTILLITSDTYSKYMNKGDRSTRVLFSDAAAATIVKKNDKEKAVLDTVLASAGKEYKSFYIPAGGVKEPKSEETTVESVDRSGNIRTLEDIHMNGFNVWKFIASTVPKQIKGILNKNDISLNDIDLFLFHQASKLTLDSLIKALKIEESKLFNNYDKVGNTVSSSIPILMKDAIDEGRLKRGNLVLLSGFGVGLSWGSVLMYY